MFFAFKTITLLIYVLAIYAFGVFLNLIIFSEYIFSHFSNQHSTIPTEYDYIVVGSGSAGSIIARRLSEDKTSKVLLLEAGSYSNSLLNIPSVGLMLQTSPFDWQYRTVPQKNACLALENQVSVWPMGKVFGGTANLNNMIYTRGHPNDYSEWFSAVHGFTYDQDILPYFKKLEEESAYVKTPPFLSQLSQSFHKAGKHLGFPETDGVTSFTGFAIPKASIVDGTRWTSSHPLRSNKPNNLKILTNSIAEKVLFRGDFEAYAVQYSHFSTKYTVKARKAIILSAGTVATPKILLLSGIGPSRHLHELKIKQKVNLEQVGENLQDHLASGIDLILLNTTLGLGIEDMLSPSAIFHYFTAKKGPWTTVGCENIAFFSTESGASVPDLQFMVLPLGVSADRGAFLAGLAGIGRSLLENYFDKISKTSVSILPIVLHPRSRGTVRLVSKDARVPPEIDPKYFSHDGDLKIMLRGIEMIKDVIKAPSMVELGAELNRIPFPGCESHVFDSDGYWECYLRRMTITSYHPVGTCAMGRVVDFDFRVLGTSKLYVADGSVLPGLPSGNPNGVIMMMAEKAADAVKNHGFLNCAKSRLKEIFVAVRICAVCC